MSLKLAADTTLIFLPSPNSKRKEQLKYQPGGRCRADCLTNTTSSHLWRQ